MENVGGGGTQLLGGQRSLRGQGEEALVTLEARGGTKEAMLMDSAANEGVVMRGGRGRGGTHPCCWDLSSHTAVQSQG